jgi:hypothetical protein
MNENVNAPAGGNGNVNGNGNANLNLNANQNLNLNGGNQNTNMNAPPTPADCNGNLVADDADIAAGTSQDCNGNGIPDECELAGNDCDGNGVPDDCQQDSDGDGIIDVCEPFIPPGGGGGGGGGPPPPGDADGDGVADNIDNCPNTPNPNQADSDGNGIGDACDPVTGCTPSWTNNSPSAQFNGSVAALTVFDDDGAGPHAPALYVGGGFTSTGAVAANHIARLDNSLFSALGTGVDDSVAALAVFDVDGAGPQPAVLYVGGSFTNAGGAPASHVAIWNGTTWSAAGEGVNDIVLAITGFDEDGAGPNPPVIFAGGAFTMTGATVINNIARWDGTSWTSVGSGLNGTIYALTVFDEDGSGPNPPALYAGGFLQVPGAASATNIARWDGTAWTEVDGGVDNSVYALTIFDDDGAGPHVPALYASGIFTMAGGSDARGIARWNGTSWSALDGGLIDSVYALTVFDDDAGGPHAPALYAAGHITTAGGAAVSNIARWNGTTWSALDVGVSHTVVSLTTFDADSTGPNLPALYAGGSFIGPGGSMTGTISRWSCPAP